MMFILKGLSVLLIFTLSVWGEVSKGSVEKTIIHYNQALIVAGKTGNTAAVKPFVTEKIATKTHLWVMAWQDDNLYMDANLLKFDLKTISIDINRSRAKTYEKWSYQYNHPSKKGYYPKKLIEYQMEYSLFLHHDKWIIDDVKIISEKQIPLEKPKK